MATDYFAFFIILALLNLSLMVFIIFHLYHGHKKHKELHRRIRDTELSISRGFALLNRGISAELKMFKSRKMYGLLPPLDQEKEIELMRDLSAIQKHIWQEIKEIGRNSW